ncbi:hypothetical protein HK099_006244 [Clydaea vesicula]|uniref:pyruvate kinase n=1 Tax=Clydaea vesicula TaxID=447962 RepID=A0AAD5XZ73_9FUNG|nr:hypothetical protein HK099_006244 [Clydaea vesicula]
MTQPEFEPVLQKPHESIRKTKIVATLGFKTLNLTKFEKFFSGPASIPKLRELILAGVNCFRLNFSCNDFGPDLPSIPLKKGQIVSIKIAPEDNLNLPGDLNTIMVQIPEIVYQLQVGHRVLLDDGSLRLKVVNKFPDYLECEVMVGGNLKPKKGINTPDIKLNIPALTDKDKMDCAFIYKMRIVYVALSFVQKAQDVQDLLDFFQAEKEKELAKIPDLENTDPNYSDIEENWRPHIISKIETPHAMVEIDAIIEKSDGIMVARGDLGVEVSFERVPVLQKLLIAKANAAEKSVITATQMLESMINSPVPTRAEVSDVANAVLDGTDAVMLSAESAVGSYPIEAVTMMGAICKTAEEKYLSYGHKISNLELSSMQNFKRSVPSTFCHSIADAAISAAKESKAKALIVFTTSSDMAFFVSKQRPICPIIAITPTLSISKRMMLLYGVVPLTTKVLKVNYSMSFSGSTEEPGSLKYKNTPILDSHNTDYILAETEKDIINYEASVSKLFSNSDLHDNFVKFLPNIKFGDTVVFTAGYHAPFPGLSNTLKISAFGDACKSQKAKKNWNFALDRTIKSFVYSKMLTIEAPNQLNLNFSVDDDDEENDNYNKYQFYSENDNGLVSHLNNSPQRKLQILSDQSIDESGISKSNDISQINNSQSVKQSPNSQDSFHSDKSGSTQKKSQQSVSSRSQDLSSNQLPSSDVDIVSKSRVELLAAQQRLIEKMNEFTREFR